jgi:hypothetical protein
VCSIVLELPNSAIGAGKVGLWARTLDRTGTEWVQADRGGRPLQAVFRPGEQREAYLLGQPAVMTGSPACSHTSWNTLAAIRRATR